jgi:hypothetical protein
VFPVAQAPDPVGTKFVVFGGNMRNDMWEFDTAAGKWRVLMTEVATSAAGWTRGAGATIAALAMACATLAMVWVPEDFRPSPYAGEKTKYLLKIIQQFCK